MKRLCADKHKLGAENKTLNEKNVVLYQKICKMTEDLLTGNVIKLNEDGVAIWNKGKKKGQNWYG